MDGPPTKKPRVRSKNFTMAEVEVLKSCVSEKFIILNAKHCSSESGVTKKMQDRAWETICERVNSVGVALRSVADVKEKWRNLTKKAKTEITQQKISMTKTGGGPPVPLADPLLEEIAGLYQSSASFHGIPGATDSETVTFTFSAPDNDEDIFDLNMTLEDSLCPDSANCYESLKPNVESRTTSGSSTIRKPETHSSATVINNDKATAFSTKSPQRSLKDVQIEFYKAATENQNEKQELIREQTAFFRQLNNTLPKLDMVLDTLLKKSGEE